MNPYKVLGVKDTATLKEIKKVFRRLSKEHHPDRGGQPSVFIEIQNAYDILSDQNARDKFDRDGVVDENHIPLSAAGRNIIIQMWEQVLDEQQAIDIESVHYAKVIDLPEVFYQKIRDMKEMLINNKTKAQGQIKILNEIRENLIYNGDQNDYLSLTIKHRIDNNKRNIKMFNRRLEELDAAKKIAQDYDYNKDLKTKDQANRQLLGNDLLDGFGI